MTTPVVLAFRDSAWLVSILFEETPSCHERPTPFPLCLSAVQDSRLFSRITDVKTRCDLALISWRRTPNTPILGIFLKINVPSTNTGGEGYVRDWDSQSHHRGLWGEKRILKFLSVKVLVTDGEPKSTKSYLAIEPCTGNPQSHHFLQSPYCWSACGQRLLIVPCSDVCYCCLASCEP